MTTAIIMRTVIEEVADLLPGKLVREAREVERLIRIAGFDPVGVGGVGECLRIEVGGDLDAAGGLNGRLVDREEAESLVGKSKSPAERR
jgi:hypothetical protein